ncbi:hypothetical protein N7539_000481 [Penicillium diatomitis]|uniref:WSC domain-containing protein n=1 Tax=Penicillium diatomitis TaxID=2819901 RepID=A0A9W9XMS3_9EURO|nr:uncharacterized protein N7539_000481 [Penicillium diatomitis]KAJ5495365.1 hypothetical protein N7539_000481 [Penicillium diatomitis]
MHHFLLFLLALLFVARPGTAATNKLTYCATANTGSDFSSAFLVSSIYQSNGLCQKTCAGYALGVLQGNRCWCTNVAPSEASRKDVSECATGCPGYPADSCGNAGKGVYAYVPVVGNSVTSTAGGGQSSSSTSSSSTSTSTSSSSSVSRDIPFFSSTTTDPATTSAGSLVTVETTLAGLVKTITVPAPTATGAQDSSNHGGGSASLSGGSIAGIVIGVLGGIALLGALIFMVFFYRKRARAVSPIPSTADMAEHRASQASSFSRGVFSQGPQDGSSLGRKHTFTDNRLKTDIYPNGPRDSSVSLQDNEDYSRPVLRVSKPNR